jgi:hypothetical protein
MTEFVERSTVDLSSGVLLCTLPSEGNLYSDAATGAAGTKYYIKDPAGFLHQLSKEQARKVYNDSANKKGTSFDWDPA